jgi:hypothetical protein
MIERSRFMKHKQILVRQKQKIVLYTVCFPVTGCFAVMLLFYDDFFCLEADPLKNFHYFKAHGHDMTFFARVAHQNRAEFAGLQCTETFGGNDFHSGEKIIDAEMRKIADDVRAVLDDVCVRRVSADKIDPRVRYELQFPRITPPDVNLTGVRASERCFFPATFQRRRIDIHTEYAPPEQLRLNERCTSARELIKHEISL